MTVTGCVSIAAFASLVCVPVGITSSVIEIQNSASTAGIKKYIAIIKKKKKKHDKIVLLGKDKLNTIEVLTSKALIDSCINHEEVLSISTVLREYNERGTSVFVVRKILTTQIQVLENVNKID